MSKAQQTSLNRDTLIFKATLRQETLIIFLLSNKSQKTFNWLKIITTNSKSLQNHLFDLEVKAIFKKQLICEPFNSVKIRLQSF